MEISSSYMTLLVPAASRMFGRQPELSAWFAGNADFNEQLRELTGSGRSQTQSLIPWREQGSERGIMQKSPANTGGWLETDARRRLQRPPEKAGCQRHHKLGQLMACMRKPEEARSRLMRERKGVQRMQTRLIAGKNVHV